MKNILKSVLTVFFLMFALLCIFNNSYAENTADVSTSASSAETQITTTVSSTSSAEEGILSPTNIINILLIAVGIVIILLAIAILTRLKKR